MRKIVLVLTSCLLLAAPVTAPAAPDSFQHYNCAFLGGASGSYPDGTTGIAVVEITISEHNHSTVRIDYYETENGARRVGSFQQVNGARVPTNADEAYWFAFEHYADRA